MFSCVVTFLLTAVVIFDFSPPGKADAWRIINDGVMGGLSRSEMILTEDSTAVFRGVLSLENYGGFASVRSAPAEFDLGAYEGIELRVMGDGRSYQIRLRTDSRTDSS